MLAPQVEVTKKGEPKAENPWSKIIRDTAKSQNWLVEEENLDQHYTFADTVAEDSSQYTPLLTSKSLEKADSIAKKVSPHPSLSHPPAHTPAPPLPAFLFSISPTEQPPPQARAASRLLPHSATGNLAEEQAAAKLTPRKRGLLIHELVQRLAQGEKNLATPNSPVQEWLAQALKPFELTTLERKKTLEEWMEKAERLIATSPFFSKPLTTRFETEIIGISNGLEIVGRIDYLQEYNDALLFGDLKTDPSIPKMLPQAYASQMGAYLALLKKIYPHKNITAYILWFETAEMQKLGAKELPKPISTLDAS